RAGPRPPDGSIRSAGEARPRGDRSGDARGRVLPHGTGGYTGRSGVSAVTGPRAPMCADLTHHDRAKLSSIRGARVARDEALDRPLGTSTRHEDDRTNRVAPRPDRAGRPPGPTQGEQSMTSTTTITQGTVSLEDARRVIAAGEESAKELGQPQNIAVVDAGGNLVAHVRMDGAWIGSVDVAINKAYTARAFDLSTAELAANAQHGGPFYGIQESNKGKVMIFAGGVPLKRDGEIVGAVGVSGGDEEQDTTVAEAA